MHLQPYIVQCVSVRAFPKNEGEFLYCSSIRKFMALNRKSHVHIKNFVICLIDWSFFQPYMEATITLVYNNISWGDALQLKP